MSGRVRVAVLGGGRSCEHDVSLASAASVADALDPVHHDVVRLTIGRDGSWHSAGRVLGLAEAVEILQGCDVVFPVVHGPLGEDGTLAALCELAGVPYVGSSTGPGALAMDKWATKLVAGAIGVATAPGLLVDARSAGDVSWTEAVVVKPVAAGSSHGVSLVRVADDLGPALEAALALDDRVLVEDVVAGREIDVAVLRRADGALVTSPALEIAVDGLFDHEAKYGGRAVFHVPAPLAPADADALDAAARAVYEALGCAGVARVDFFLTEGGPVLNEVNTMPGMTEHSQVPRMFAAAGLSYADLLAELVRGAHRTT
jgi:D-alanine-D-alanine ligase